MNLITDRANLLPPAVCFVCECAPSEGQPTVDTLQDYVANGPDKLEGRKYVCGGCAIGIGQALGFVPVDRQAAAEQAAHEAAWRLRAVRDHINDFAAGIVAKLDNVEKSAAAEATPQEEPVAEQEVIEGTDELNEPKPEDETDVKDKAPDGSPVEAPDEDEDDPQK